MHGFDTAVWIEIGKRLAEFIPATAKDRERWAGDHGLGGIQLSRIANGRKGTSVENLMKLCKAADINPTYLLFGKGCRHLSDNVPGMEDENSAASIFSSFLKHRKPLPLDLQNKLREQVHEAIAKIYAEAGTRHLPDAPATKPKAVKKGAKRS